MHFQIITEKYILAMTKYISRNIGKKNITMIFLIFILCCSIENGELKHHLEKLQQRYSSIQTSGWKVLNYDQEPNTICYTLERKNLDTIVFMEFCKVLHDSIWNPGEEYYAVVAYRKLYKERDFEHIIYGIQDTGYHIKYPINQPDSIIFISGKYFYQWRYGLLNKDQKTFYVNHSDSLEKLRGNDLLELPGR